MEHRTPLALVAGTESARRLPTGQGPGTYPALREAGLMLGMSGPALRKKFDRGDLPRQFLLRVGPRTLRVDIAGLIAFLKAQASQVSA